MRFVVDRPTVLLIAVAIFAPLSYLAAERLGAVVFPMGGLFTSAVVGIVWVLLAPVLIALVNYLEKETPGVAAQGESLSESQEMKHG